MNITLLPDGRSPQQDDFAKTLRDLLSQYAAAGDPGERGVWKQLTADIGVAGFCLPDEAGGVEAGLGDLLVLHEELGYALAGADLVAHHVAVSVLRSGWQNDDLATLADGTVRATIHLPANENTPLVRATVEGGDWRLEGGIEDFVSAPGADVVVVLAHDTEGQAAWYSVTPALGTSVRELRSLDLTRRVGRVEFDGATASRITMADPALCLDEARRMRAYLAAGEALGGARRCLELAVEHATQRRQFGRPIGSFQAVKHLLADGLVRLEQALATLAAVARDGLDARLPLPAAQRLSLDAHVQAAQELIQTLGGLGFTWEHEAHLHLRRAAATRNLCPALPVDRAAQPSPTWGTDKFSRKVRAWFEANGRNTSQLRPAERRMDHHRIGLARQHQAELAGAGLAGLTWPTAFGGQGLGPRQVYDFTRAAQGYDTYTDVTTISLGIAAPLLLDFGTSEQQKAYLPGLLRLDALWCQLFSEPESGSDLAGVQTRARRDGDHFVIDGQKVWTTNADAAQYGLLLARTDPQAPKHQGLTMFVLDMAAPGVEVRPIKQITGEHEFCEVFLDDVRIPTDRVLGEVGGGWQAALATLTYERITLGSGTYKEMADGCYDTLRLAAARAGKEDDPVVLATLDDIRVHEVALDELTGRIALEVAEGRDPGAAASICKLLTASLTKRAADLRLRLGGPAAVAWSPEEPDADDVAFCYLYAPSTTIAGGTDHIQRTIIGEQLLGLPREPRFAPAPR